MQQYAHPQEVNGFDRSNRKCQEPRSSASFYRRADCDDGNLQRYEDSTVTGQWRVRHPHGGAEPVPHGVRDQNRVVFRRLRL